MYLNVDWSQRADYILRRHGLKPSEAAEALADPRRLVLDPDPASLSGQSIRVIGWSPGRRELLTVIVVKHQGASSEQTRGPPIALTLAGTWGCYE